MITNRKTAPILDTWKQNANLIGKPKTPPAGAQPPMQGPMPQPVAKGFQAMAMTPEQTTAELTRKANTPGSAPPSAANKPEYDAIVKAMGSASVNGSPPSMDTGSAGVTVQGQTQGQGQGQGQGAMTYANGYMEDANRLITQLGKIMETPYNFDYKSDPSYLAAVQQAQEGAKIASRNTLETMNDRGIVNSSVTSGQLGQIEQAAQNEPLKLLPQLEANAYGRYQQGISNQFNMLGTLMQAGQFQQGYDQSEKFHKDDNAFRKADAIGYYMDPQTQGLIQTVMNSKQAYAGAKTPEERQKAMADANSARTALKSMGMQNVDQMFGGGVSMDQFSKNMSGFQGIETMAHQQIGKEDKKWKDQFGLEKDKFQLDKDKFAWDKTKPRGGSSGGMTYSQTRDRNTDSMYLQMRLDGVHDSASGMEWIRGHMQDITAGNVDPGTLLSKIDGFKSPSGADKPPGGKTDYEIYADARKYAEQDPEWDSAINETTGEVDQNKREAIVEKWRQKLSDINNPPPPPYVGAEGWNDATLLHKQKWKDSLY